jgi:hypothetical protein
MNNIPGLRFEPYMDAVKDYLQKVEFKLSGYTGTFGDKKTVNETWNAVANDLLGDESFGGAIKKNLQVPDDLKLMVAAEASNIRKATAVYNYVKNNFTWNGYYSKYACDGLKKILDSRTGTSGEINLLLINFLQSFKVNTSPLLVAERDFGKVYPIMCMLTGLIKQLRW